MKSICCFTGLMLAILVSPSAGLLADEKPFECLSLADAKKAVLDESIEPYFSELQRREIGALTGKAAVGETLEQVREDARERFRAAVLPFSEKEVESLKWYCDQLNTRLATDMPLIAKQPWRFLKVADHLCGGFSHTRGTVIIFSQGTLNRIVQGRAAEKLRSAGTLLLHEKFHVLQRLYPKKFAKLYTDIYGFHQATIRPNAWLDRRQIANPDAIRLEWLIAVQDGDDGGSSFYWPRTILRGDSPVPTMGRDFLDIAVRVVRKGKKYQAVLNDDGQPEYRQLSSLTSHVDRYSTRRGLEHPNELAAYMSGQMLIYGYLLEADELPKNYEQDIRPRLKPFMDWCHAELR